MASASIPFAVYANSASKSVPNTAGAVGDQLDVMKTHRRLVYAENERPAFWWLKGRKFGVLDGQIRHLWDMSTGIISQGAVQEDGAYHVSVYEAYFQFHPNTEDLMVDWTNPYTDITDVVTLFRPTVAHHRFKEPVSESNNLVAGRVFNSIETIEKPRVLDQTVWQDITKTFEISSPDNGQKAKPFRISENLVYSAHVNELDEGYGYRSTRCDLNMWTDWLENMKMDGYPGGLLSTAQGQKLDSYDAFPESFRELMKAHFPEVASDPVAFVGKARQEASSHDD